MSCQLTLLFLIVATCILRSDSVWTKFDLVRPFRAWGSNRTTPFVRIAGLDVTKNGPNITFESNFGSAVANLGDLNGDGYADIAVGASGESINYGSGLQRDAGSVYILFLGFNASVKSTVRINGLENNGPQLYAGAQFGYSLAVIGDLNEDGWPELAVGAPGSVVSAVYILFLKSDGSVIEYKQIQGQYIDTGPNGTLIAVNTSFSSNGPPISYGSRFGASLCTIGDFNMDGIPDLAVGQVDLSKGTSLVFFLYLDRQGLVLNYTTIGPGTDHVPNLPPYSGFGTSMYLLPDLNGDLVPELAVGAPFLYVAGSLNIQSGEVFILFLFANGSVNHTTTLGTDKIVPFVPEDLCGTALTSIGDINRDAYRQQHPTEISPKGRVSIPDLVVGCPQTFSAGLVGRIMFWFLNRDAELVGSTVLPSAKDQNLGLDLNHFAQLGQSLAAYTDIDKNGLKEILIGAPNDNITATAAGAVYIFFPRRERYHPRPFDYLRYYLIVIFVPGTLFCLCCAGIASFCWVFRRIPDPAEILVKEAGLEINPKKPRAKYKKDTRRVYATEYTA